MCSQAASSVNPFGHFEQLQLAREVLQAEGRVLSSLSESLGDDFLRAVDLLHHCTGSVIVSGMGKAGLVGQKLAATLASTGTRGHFLHPGEAVHGDLGRVHKNDLVLILSYSGETEEILRLLPSLAEMKTSIIAITRSPNSSLGRNSNVTLELGTIIEACPLGLAPSTSTTAMLGIGDALALVLSRLQQFGAEDFARFHPGGSLGRKLAKVEEIMRPLNACRIANQSQTIRQVFTQGGRPGRRTGAIMLLDDQGLLSGFFTDSDLARLLERNQDVALDRPISEVMTRSPQTIQKGQPLPKAIETLKEMKISELPVIDEEGKPLGMIDVTDLVGVSTNSEMCDSNDNSAPKQHQDVPQTVPFPKQDKGRRLG